VPLENRRRPRARPRTSAENEDETEIRSCPSNSPLPKGERRRTTQSCSLQGLSCPYSALARQPPRPKGAAPFVKGEWRVVPKHHYLTDGFASNTCRNQCRFLIFFGHRCVELQLRKTSEWTAAAIRYGIQGKSHVARSKKFVMPLCGATLDESSVPPWTRGDFRGVFERWSKPTPALCAIPPTEGIFRGEDSRFFRLYGATAVHQIFQRPPAIDGFLDRFPQRFCRGFVPIFCVSFEQSFKRRSRLIQLLGIKEQTHESEPILRLAGLQPYGNLGVRDALFKSTTQHEAQMGQGVVCRSEAGPQLNRNLQLASRQIGQGCVLGVRSCSNISA